MTFGLDISWWQEEATAGVPDRR